MKEIVSDTILAERAFAQAINQRNKENAIHLAYERLVNQANDLCYAVAEFCKLGLTPENSSHYFGRGAEYNYLQQKALEVVTKLYTEMLKNE